MTRATSEDSREFNTESRAVDAWHRLCRLAIPLCSPSAHRNSPSFHIIAFRYVFVEKLCRIGFYPFLNFPVSSTSVANREESRFVGSSIYFGCVEIRCQR